MPNLQIFIDFVPISWFRVKRLFIMNHPDHLTTYPYNYNTTVFKFKYRKFGFDTTFLPCKTSFCHHLAARLS